ncbi:MAG TPA: NnrS family protein [Dyella sp.]|uniref:NnrS family protein n=1 Tax=Dyella sp. TaxID=1869338 RepID=UPI002D7907C8|nr:NnrS family protein [Dyella sp.]HET6554214.1 NnrS family protein [Dyella sp.]
MNSTSSASLSTNASLLTFLHAPHRAMFLIGAFALLANMVWWTCALMAVHFGAPFAPQAMPASWAHGFLMQYASFAPFVFGFVLTVFPRWMNQPEIARPIYGSIFGLMLGGGIAVLVAQSGWLRLLPFGMAAMLAGWLIALTVLGIRLLRHRPFDAWAASCHAALCMGGIGLALALAFACGAPAALMHASVEMGTFGFLLPTYVTVAHRMVPFFSGNVISNYRVVRPRWVLAAMWLLVFAHLACDILDVPSWRWLADAPLTFLFLGQWLAWQPWRARHVGLLAVLYIALAWLPLAFAFFTADSVLIAWHGNSGMAHAPLHALTIGFFASMLVAMVTRVTHGHSGRPLAMVPVAWIAFVGMQITAVVRVAADGTGQPATGYLLAGALWLIVLMPWVARSIWIYATHRRDGKPG